jgi:hypothetical protein
MAQSMLVERFIEDGWELINHLLKADFPILTACWAKVILDDDQMGDRREWQLFLVSPLVDEQGPADAYEKAYNALRSMPQFDQVFARISLGMIKLIGERNPITQAVSQILKRFHGKGPIYVRRCRLGQIQAEEVYVYPLTLPDPWQKVVLKSGKESQGIPARTVVNARVLGAGAEPNPLMEFQTQDGKQSGTVYKDDTEPAHGPVASVFRN